MYVLGVDFGGGASKATLIDKYGRVIATASTEYPTYFGEGGMAEQDPSDWYSAALKNIKEITRGIDTSLIDALCFDAPTHTAVLLDNADEPVCRSVYWTDTRSVCEKHWLEKNYGEYILKKCKHHPDTIWTLPQIMFLRKTNPEIFDRVARVCFAKDFVRRKFTGDFVTDYVEAEGSMLFDFDSMDWDDTLLSLAGLSREMMPRIVSPLEVVGAVCEPAARESGLAVGTKVICGTTDTAMEVFAAGAVRNGDMTLKLATAGRLCVISDNAYPDKCIVNYSHIKEGLFYPGAGTKSCASSLRWFRDTFGGDFSEFDEMAKIIPIGSDGLMFHPYLVGELTPYADPTLRASFIGISASHTKAHFSRAIMEGVAMSLLDCKEYMLSQGITLGARAYAIGGGAKSEVWRQMIADALDITLIVTERSDSSFGAAMCAGISAGYFKNADDAVARRQVVLSETAPIHKNTEKYRTMYKKYKKIGKVLSEINTNNENSSLT